MSHRKGLMTRCFGALAAALFAVCAAGPVHAASDGVSVRLPVSQSFLNHTAAEAEDTFAYRLTPLEEGTPLPEQSNGFYSFTLQGTEDVELPAMAFTRAGVYRYELKQIVETEKDGYTYDREVYTVEIYVTNAADGGLAAAVVAYASDGGKTDRLHFENSLQKPPPDNTPEPTDEPENTPPPTDVPGATPPPTGDEPGGSPQPTDVPQPGSPTQGPAWLPALPQTGDGSHPLLWAVLLAVGAAGFAAAWIARKKGGPSKRDDQNK